ncbi:MAG: helix-turn-helix domain-containing protein [Acidimicrobiales bacterium]
MKENPKTRRAERQSVPRPGQPVRGSSTGRPLTAALDLLGRRWSLRVLWELTDGPLGARALRDNCDRMSPDVLYTRLKELTEAGLIDKAGDQRYQLTSIGADLRSALDPLDQWARRWAERPTSTR